MAEDDNTIHPENYEHLPAKDFKWEKGPLGLETVRFKTDEVVMSIVRGKKGDITKVHSHSLMSIMYVIEGKMEVGGKILTVGDAGVCRPADRYGGQLLEDSTFIVCRSIKDDIRVQNVIEEARKNE